ncbi:MAG: ATPase, T2SS/T4P/T4SS family, partial [Thermodesulfovibrionales bacterium]|nr:ATPase, T2SS/T4P/T4SS family [Thermodesulfovibrionales bacterium]
MTFQRKGSNKSFEELLIEHKIITQDKLLQYTQKMAKEKKSLEQILSEAGISDEKIAPVKAEFLGYVYEDVTNYPLSSDLLKHIKPSYAKNYKVLPLKYEDDIFTLAMAEPRDFIALDEITRIYRNARFKIKDVKIVMSSIQCIYAAIDKFYAIPKEKEEIGIGSILDQVKETYKSTIEVAEVTKDDATENSAPVVMLANKIVEEAFQKRTSDIHLEPTLEFLRIRYRIDGDLTEVMRVPKYAQDALITRFKIMCDMRIDEKRQPQDGRIDFTKYNPSIEIDLRVSTVPTPHGEDVVMRILDKKSSILNLDMLGFSDHNMKLYKEALNSPYGIILHVGPTGSGKSTALFAALKTLDTPDVKIVTAEDPVEYTLGGQIIQSNIHPAAGYTFAKAMRAFMRHDPDIILVGEIRDQ